MMAKHKGISGSDSEGVLQIASNKQARRDFEILDTFEVGLVLLGSEVKSIRLGGVNLKEAYIRPIGQELFIVGCHISPYSFSRQDSHAPTRDRKLLLHRKEIDQLASQVQRKGLSIVPLRIYMKSGLCKLEIGLGRGKKLYDKRQDVKTREANRDMERAFSSRNR